MRTYAFVILLLALPAAARAESAASGLLYERALMQAAGARCGLFRPEIVQALGVARDQARSAALRAGDRASVLAATELRATSKAASVDCHAPGLQTAAQRVRQAFADYAQLSVMRFPGPRSAWRAERPDPRLKGARWRLVQALPGTGGWVLFGTLDGGPVLLDARRGVAPAASVRIRLRDPSRLGRPFLLGGPPPAVSRTWIASARRAAPRTLWPAEATGALLYAFPSDLATALAELDPRESAAVELVDPAAGRDRIYAAALEIGDMKAAQAFLADGAPPSRR